MTDKPKASGGKRANAGRPRGKRYDVARKTLTEELLPVALVKLKTAVDNGEQWAVSLVVTRAMPTLKPDSGTLPAGVTAGKTMVERGDNIFKAIETGEISATVAMKLLQGLAIHAKAIEASELVDRIDALERLLTIKAAA